MGEGIYLRCSPSNGWSIGVYDANWTLIRELVSSVPTMEEAMRRFAILAGNSIFMKLTDPQLGQTRLDLYPLSGWIRRIHRKLQRSWTSFCARSCRNVSRDGCVQRKLRRSY